MLEAENWSNENETNSKLNRAEAKVETFGRQKGFLEQWM